MDLSITWNRLEHKCPLDETSCSSFSSLAPLFWVFSVEARSSCPCSDAHHTIYLACLSGSLDRLNLSCIYAFVVISAPLGTNFVFENHKGTFIITINESTAS
jgi:hypothetical protein